MKEDANRLLAAMLPDERRAVGIVALIAMIRMFGLFALLPVLSVFAGELEGATPLLIGLAVGAYGLTQAALQIPLAVLSHRYGRIPVILGGLAVFAAGSILAAQSETIHGVIAGRLLQGAGAVSATLAALLTDATREQVRTRTMAIFGIGVGFSFLLALVAGPVIAAATSVRSLFWLAAALAGVAALLLLALPRAIPRPVKHRPGGIRAAFRGDLLRLDAYVFLLHTLLTASFVALPFLLRNELQLVMTGQWKVYVLALLVSLVGTVPLIVADERGGKRWTLTAAIALLIAGELALALAGFSTTTVVVALAIFFAGFNFLEAGLPARLSLAAEGEIRGASFGVFSSSQFLGAFAGGLLGGRFLAGGQPGTVFLACALVAGLWLLLHQGYGRSSNRDKSSGNRAGN
ncbi:MAG TPA: MFS transporter [Woeseiaceae bacterium]|nr:MFS transporter [Woeseiaceae bacterium]